MKKRITDWIRPIGTLLITIAFMAVTAITIQAQNTGTPSQTNEVQELKKQVKQLQDMVEQLNKKISTVEEAQKQAPASAPAPAPAATSEISTPSEEPRAKIKDGAAKSTAEIYGFAMLDAGYQFKANHPQWYDTLRVTKLPAFGGEFAPKGNTYWGVRQSRLGVKTSTPTKYGELKTVFEFELFGTGADAGQTTFRLRHAYGELGQVGAGQYWTVFGDTDTFPNSFEYWGPPGLIWYRNVGVRWMPLKGKNSLTIGLERPGASADQGNYADRIALQGVKPKFDMPDIMANYRVQRDWGHVQFAGILRKISWIDTVDDDVDVSDTVWGYGTSVTSALNFSKNDVGRFSFVYGTGIQNYFNDAPVDVGVELLDDVSQRGGTPLIKGVTLPILGLSAFLDHRWNERFTSAMGWSMINIENSNGQAADAFKRGHYALGNLAWYPVNNVMIGGELQYGRRQNFLDNYSSEDFRIQFAFKYNFSRKVSF